MRRKNKKPPDKKAVLVLAIIVSILSIIDKLLEIVFKLFNRWNG